MAYTIVKFDKRADIQLLVTVKDNTPTVFQCCSRTLARSSPLFHRLIYGDLAKPRNNDNESEAWSMDMTRDEPEALTLFLNILHGHFDQLPQFITIKALYDLVTITHNYEATRTLTPWTDSWLHSVAKPSNTDRISQFRMLWVCWELHCGNGFSQTANQIMTHSKKSELIEIPQEISLQTPPDIVERIRAIRFQIIGEIFSLVEAAVTSFIVVDHKPHAFQRAAWIDCRKCESIMLGSLITNLMMANIWPLPDAHDYEGSISDLRGKITDMVLRDMGGDMEELDVEHTQCNPGPKLLQQVERVVEEAADPVNEFHREHLNKQL